MDLRFLHSKRAGFSEVASLSKAGRGVTVAPVPVMLHVLDFGDSEPSHPWIAARGG